MKTLFWWAGLRNPVWGAEIPIFRVFGHILTIRWLGRPKFHFLAPENGQSDFGCKKIGLRTPKFENGDHFLSPTIPKNERIDICFTWISFSVKFWANFENRVIYAHFWPISLYKTPKSKTFSANGQNFENWYLGSSYIETIGFRRPAHKKGLFIF